MGWISGAIEIFKKLLDLVLPWSSYWVEKKKKKNQKKEDAQKAMDDATKKGDLDAFLDARSDRDSV